MSQSFVLSFEHLKGKPYADQALRTLQHVASLVKPIMRQHGWRLPVLAEFFPDNPTLLGLNINQGQKILLRLRPADAPDTFLNEEDVIQTMLHELTHNIHGPHDDTFYKFLAGLQGEYDALRRSGYVGEGFFSPGHRLGVGVSHNVPPHQARRKALEAIEKRAQRNKVLGRGGRLGGRLGATSNLSLRELAARAAENRARDERTCGTGSNNPGGTSLAEKEAEKAHQESTSTQAPDLLNGAPDYPQDKIAVVASDSHNPGKQETLSTAYEPRSEWACPSCTLLNEVSRTSCSLCETKRSIQNVASNPSQPIAAFQTSPTRPKPQHPFVSPSASGSQDTQTQAAKGQALPPKSKDTEPSLGKWECSTCTLINDSSSLECMACTVHRPLDNSVGWTCIACDAPGNSHSFWSCRSCGAIKISS